MDDMSALTLYSKFETLPDHLKQQVLDYIEFLLSREAIPDGPVPPRKGASKNTVNATKSRFAGRISPTTAAQLQQQLQEMREEWP
ncbi:MAG: DUF2281 domain-containing protein [Lewinellaceae bacterium]|nr:DUF2281 domain-containing protein [Lewinellaceae bacterium]